MFDAILRDTGTMSSLRHRGRGDRRASTGATIMKPDSPDKLSTSIDSNPTDPCK